MDDDFFFITMFFTFIMVLFAGFSGNRYTFLAILLPVSVLHILTNDFAQYMYLAIFPVLSTMCFSLLVWRKPFFTPKIWTKISNIGSVILTFTILIFLLLKYAQEIRENLSFVFIIYGFLGLGLLFIFSKFFIFDVILILLNQTKTIDKNCVQARFLKIRGEARNKQLQYFVVLENKSERIRINVIAALYLTFFAKGKMIEITFKKGWLGIEYCNSFPKILK